MESPDGGTRPTGATEATSAEWFGGRRAVSFGPTAYRRGEGSINANPWIGLSGSPVEQLLDAKTNVSPMSRRRDARRSLRADRPRGESGGDGQAAAYPGRNIRSRRGACAGETRSEGALYGQGFFLPEVGGLFSAVRSKTLKKKKKDLAYMYAPMEAAAHAL